MSDQEQDKERPTVELVDVQPETEGELSESSSGVEAEGGLESRLLEAQAKADEYYDKYLRTYAELENLRKRAMKEKSEILRYAGESLARDILEVIDTLELALNQSSDKVDDLLEGVRLVTDKFATILQAHSIISKTTKGDKFNPEFQEALATVPTSDVAPGTVLEEYRKPYFFRDKLLRVGQVVVSGSSSQVQSETNSSDANN